MNKCGEKTEVYSRIVGYYRPVQQWNNGKKEEYKNRKVYKVEGMGSEAKFDIPVFEVNEELAGV